MGRTQKASTEVTVAITVKQFEDQLICENGKSKYLLFIIQIYILFLQV